MNRASERSRRCSFYSPPMCSPFSATERFISSTRTTRTTPGRRTAKRHRSRRAKRLVAGGGRRATEGPANAIGPDCRCAARTIREPVLNTPARGGSEPRVSSMRARWNCSRRIWIVCAIEVPTLPPSVRSRLKSPTAAPRRCGGVYLDAATLIGANNSPRPRVSSIRGPTTWPGLISQIQHRHPVITRGHNYQADRDRPTGVNPPGHQDANEQHCGQGRDARGRHHQPGAKGVVSEQRLEHPWQCHARGIEHAKAQNITTHDTAKFRSPSTLKSMIG